MAEMTITITGPLADIKEGDKIWTINDVGEAVKHTVIGVDYCTNSDGEWVVDYFRCVEGDLEGTTTTIPDDGWDWLTPGRAFLTEKDAIQNKITELDAEIYDDEECLHDKRSMRHKLQRRLTVLTDGELFDGD